MSFISGLSDFLNKANNMPLWKSAFLLATIIIIISLVATGKTWLSLLFFIISFILLWYILKDIGWIKRDFITILQGLFP